MDLPRQILRPFLGARILKTGLSAFSVLVAFNWVGHEYVALAAVSAILAIQPSITQSRRQFIHQLWGNLVGGGVGVILAFFLGSSPLSMALGVVLVLGILAQLGLTEAASLSAVAVIFIMERPHEDLLLYTGIRVTAISAGVVTGYLVNRYIRPPRFITRLQEELQAVGGGVDQFIRHLEDSLSNPSQFQKDQIKSEAGAIQRRLDNVRYLLDLSRESDGEDPRRPALAKATASMFVFVENIMDIHKIVLQAGGLRHTAERDTVMRALEAVMHLRRSVMDAALQEPSRSPAPVPVPVPAPENNLAQALDEMEQLVDTLVETRESRPVGMALYGVYGNIRHMGWRMETLSRMLRQE